MKLKMMRENPFRFDAAVMIATREQNLTKRFQLRTQNSDGASSQKSFGPGVSRQGEYEPMEVSHASAKVHVTIAKIKTAELGNETYAQMYLKLNRRTIAKFSATNVLN